MRNGNDALFPFTSITAEQAQEFRRSMSINPALIADSWDQKSQHYAIFRAGEIVGTSRLTQEMNCQLPFTDYVQLQAKIKPGSVEIGRTLILPKMRVAPANVSMYRNILQEIRHISPECSRVCIDGIDQSGLSHRALQKLGFTSTNREYFDSRYNARSVVFEAHYDNLIKNLNRMGFYITK